jgi:hypothetical protein
VTRRANLRASDEDRDHIIDRLRKAATEGRIAAEELEQRVSQALKARTYGELDQTVADIPGPRGRRQPVRRTSAGWALSVVRENPLLIVVAIPVLAVAAAMLLAVAIVWATLMVVVLILGGRPHGPRGPHGPWAYSRRRQGYGPSRRGARSYWA